MMRSLDLGRASRITQTGSPIKGRLAEDFWAAKPQKGK